MTGSFSLVEKLALAGAFCAIVVMAVGTEDDPGLIAGSKEATGSANVMVEPPPPIESASSVQSMSNDSPAAPSVALESATLSVAPEPDTPSVAPEPDPPPGEALPSGPVGPPSPDPRN